MNHSSRSVFVFHLLSKRGWHCDCVFVSMCVRGCVCAWVCVRMHKDYSDRMMSYPEPLAELGLFMGVALSPGLFTMRGVGGGVQSPTPSPSPTGTGRRDAVIKMPLGEGTFLPWQFCCYRNRETRMAPVYTE